jgi:hypothetical protein
MKGRLYIVSGYAPGERRATTLVWAEDMEEALNALPWAWSATVTALDGSGGHLHATCAPWFDFETDEEPRARIEIA